LNVRKMQNSILYGECPPDSRSGTARG
jgi:hypothetical protein